KKGLVNGNGTEMTSVQFPPPPNLAASAPRRSSLGFTLDLHRIQRDYIDLVPKHWHVISLSLSDGGHDLCITRLQAGQAPFVLRLPLERASSRDSSVDETDVFDFHTGRAELLEIIKEINRTCHDSRDMAAKGEREKWWAEREALDQRLKELLMNIEHVWLGGFRGVFSQHGRRPELLEKFRAMFEGVLDKHLPSRRQVGRGKKGKGVAGQTKVVLDGNVLELFIGLGDATKSGADFDEELTDLLYFVVDILQFHGERNAYDEIDFDSMVVETMDALMAYHAEANAAPESDSHAHTILVLDKQLHVFPWESLPCLQGLAVSRIPSLACLRKLLLDRRRSSSQIQGEDSEEEDPRSAGHHAPLSGGTYILNPSSDLLSTQKTFESLFSTHLHSPNSWTRIISRPPTEPEFLSALTHSPILLYFGHGSGAQYIRSRNIRHLDHCRATVLLMGCSSAALTAKGEFEPSGPVWNYMLAGAPAVVGTLWDVTDRDIDRFAGGVLEGWGVLPEGCMGEKNGKKKAGRNGLSLVQAVAKARDRCRFRYVTAAAAVVYGIPVYVDVDGKSKD
nr:Chain A, separase [Thermochaetoides thermophila DSM 1495]